MSTENTNTEQEVINDPIMDMFMESIPGNSNQNEQSSTDDVTKEEVVNEDVKANTDSNANSDNMPNDVADDKNKPAEGGESNFDINGFLEQSSEGLFKSEDDLKSAISKLKEYDSLQGQIESLKAEKDNIFANDHIKTLNRLHKEGKTDEQIEEYMKLSKLDLSALDSKEVLIQREIAKGHTRHIAEMSVERKYGLDKLSFDEEKLTASEIETNKRELEYAESVMKVEADSARKELQDEFASLTQEVSATDKALQEAAAKQAYRAKLEPFVQNNLIANFPKQLVVGDEATGVVTYDVPNELLDTIKANAFEYFADTEVSNESVATFMTVQKALWAYDNLQDILSKVKNQADVAAEKRIRAEYENHQGLPKPNDTAVVKEANVNDVLMSIANDSSNY